VRNLALILLFAAVAAGQGRDSGQGETPLIFVRWFETTESDAIHRVAWQALEPHRVSRRRIATFDRDEKKARAYLRKNRDAKVVVAYNPEIARIAAKELPKAAVLRIHEEKGAHVHARADRDRFHAAIRLIGSTNAWSRRVPTLVPPGKPDRHTSGFGPLDWVQEGAKPPPGDKPVWSTTSYLPEGRAVLTMRPDPRSLGLHVAAQVLRHLRTGKAFSTVTVQRMRITIDLDAAKRAKIAIPLRLLARADVVRRSTVVVGRKE